MTPVLCVDILMGGFPISFQTRVKRALVMLMCHQWFKLERQIDEIC